MLLNHSGKTKLDATTELQSFGLIVTAEPYFAVTQPRDVVVMERWTGAEQCASDTFQKAVVGLENAEGYLIGKAGQKPIGTMAREAVQMAEDARIITVKKIEEQQLAAERTAGAEREARAEGDRAAARCETDRVTRDAEQGRLTAVGNAERVKRENDAQITSAQMEATA